MSEPQVPLTAQFQEWLTKSERLISLLLNEQQLLDFVLEEDEPHYKRSFDAARAALLAHLAAVVAVPNSNSDTETAHQTAPVPSEINKTALPCFACDNAVQWAATKRGPGPCEKWCGDGAKCITTIKPLPEYEADPFRHLTKAIRHLLSCYDGEVMDEEVRRLTLPLIALRDRLEVEAGL